MTLTHTTKAPAGLDSLRRRFDGEIVGPGDPRYDGLRRVWNGSIDRYPSAILRPAHRADVARAIRFARERELVTAIRAGGHSLPGYSSCDGGVVIDLRLIDHVQVDTDRGEAVAGAGQTWGGFDRATQAHGLATPGGEVSDTGIAGLTLGGGIGWLRRLHGLTCDNLLGVDLVTVEGELVHADADHHPDLFWAVRGGGGNFGVVTSFRYRLHRVGTFLGGMVMHPLERGQEALRFLRDMAADAPDELSLMAAIVTAPAAPFVPLGLQGRPVVVLAAAYFGSLADGERVMAPLRHFGPPGLDALRPMTYVEIQSMVDAANPAGMQGYFKSEMLSDLTDDVIDAVVDAGASPTSPTSQILLHRLGGAMSRVPHDDTAFAHRGAGYMATVATTWAAPGDDAARHVDWTRRLWSSLRDASAGTYVNHLGVEGQDRVRQAYGNRTYERLAAVKATWDPENFLRLNQNIVPAST